MLFLAVVKDFNLFAKMKIQFKRGMVHCALFYSCIFELIGIKENIKRCLKQTIRQYGTKIEGWNEFGFLNPSGKRLNNLVGTSSSYNNLYLCLRTAVALPSTVVPCERTLRFIKNRLLT